MKNLHSVTDTRSKEYITSLPMSYLFVGNQSNEFFFVEEEGVINIFCM